jgi:hypothetical protein
MSDDKEDKGREGKVEPGKLGAGATMQIDLDQVQLVDLEAVRSPSASPVSPNSRKTPPPLPEGMLPPAPPAEPGSETHPASAPVPPPPLAPTSLAPAPAEPPSKLAMHIGVIALVVGVAVAAGLWVAHAVGSRGGTTTTAPSAAEPTATHSAPPVDSVLTIPPIEVR